MDENRMKTEVAGPGDIPAIVDLFNLVFRDRRDIDAWNSLYSLTPAGPPISCVVRSGSGEIVGHLGAIPGWYRKGPDHMKGALLVDIMVHPEWTRRGLATRLSLAMHEVLGAGFDLSIGFSNRQALHTHIKTGMSDLGKAPVYLRPPRYGIGVRSRRKRSDPTDTRGGALSGSVPSTTGLGGMKGNVQIRRVSLDDPDLAPRISDDAAPYWHRSRDLSTLRWRCAAGPRGHYDFYLLDVATEGAGYMVLARREIMGLDAGIIVDIRVDEKDREAARFLLSEAVGILSTEGIQVINVLFRGNAAVLSALRRLGFLRLPQSFFPAQLNVVFKAYSEAARLIPADQRSWGLTWSDTDLV